MHIWEVPTVCIIVLPHGCITIYGKSGTATVQDLSIAEALYTHSILCLECYVALSKKLIR